AGIALSHNARWCRVMTATAACRSARRMVHAAYKRDKDCPFAHLSVPSLVVEQLIFRPYDRTHGALDRVAVGFYAPIAAEQREAMPEVERTVDCKRQSAG